MNDSNSIPVRSSFAELDTLMPLILEQLEAGGQVSFSPRGISMLPMLRQGRDSVVLSPVTGKLKKYDLPLYRRADGKYILHRIVKVGSTYTCVGDNQFELERGVAHSQIIAVVTAFTRDGRVIPVTDPAYRRYCRFWHYVRPARFVWRQCRLFLRRLRR